MPRSSGGDGFDDQSLQHFLVYISELLDVEAAFAGRVLAELCEQRFGAAKPGHAIQNDCGLTWRKSDQRHIALAPAVVRIVDAAEADDGRAPHFRLFAGRALHQLDERLRVRALGLVHDGLDECRHTHSGGLGLIFCHSYFLPSLTEANITRKWSIVGKRFEPRTRLCGTWNLKTTLEHP